MDSARHTYVVTYDICDPKRLAAVYKVMRGFGEHLQLSVFRCDLSSVQWVAMKSALLDVIDAHADQILIVDLGPSDGRGGDAIVSLGRVWGKHGKVSATVV